MSESWQTALPRDCQWPPPLPNGKLVRVPKLRRGKAIVVGLDDRQVRGAVHAHHHGVVLLAVVGVTVTRTLLVFSTTWALVMIYPSLVAMMPVPELSVVSPVREAVMATVDFTTWL